MAARGTHILLTESTLVHTKVYRVAATSLLPCTAQECRMPQDGCMTHWRGGSASTTWGGTPASTPNLTPATSPAWLTRWRPRSHAPATWRRPSKRRGTHARRPTAGTKQLRAWGFTAMSIRADMCQLHRGHLTPGKGATVLYLQTKMIDLLCVTAGT